VEQVLPATGPCSKIDLKQANAALKVFLKSAGIPNNWFVGSVTENLGKCFLILSEFDGEMSGNADMLIYNPVNKKISHVRDAFKLPATLRASIGAHRAPNASTFFWEFKGASVEEIMKNVYSKYPNYGSFIGCVDSKTNDPSSPKVCKEEGRTCKYLGTGKLAWDTTPSRQWKLAAGQFDNHIGMANEVDDIYAQQLDGEFNEYISGSLGCSLDASSARGSVMPWTGFVDKIYINGKWTPVEYDPRFTGEDTPAANYSHEAVLRSGANGTECVAAVAAISGVLEAKPYLAGPPGAEVIVSVSIKLKGDGKAALAAIKSLQCIEAVSALQ